MNNIFKAWIAKFEQAYQKALLLFSSDDDFERIQKLYENCQNDICTERNSKLNKYVLNVFKKNIAAFIGLLLILLAIVLYDFGRSATILILVGCIILIASACFLNKRHSVFIDYAINVGSGLMALILSLCLKNGLIVKLSGFVILIIVVVSYFIHIKDV